MEATSAAPYRLSDLMGMDSHLAPEEFRRDVSDGVNSVLSIRLFPFPTENAGRFKKEHQKENQVNDQHLQGT